MRLSDKAHQLIRHKIITLELPPLSPIDEQALMDDLQLGRTPIREALQRLTAEDLVSIVPHRGIFVADISLTDLQKIFELRMVLEGFCARLAAQRINDEQVAQLEAILDELDDVDKADMARPMDIDNRFHELFYETADNEFLADSLSRLHALSERLWWLVLERFADVRMEVAVHRDLIPALKARDADRAEALIQNQLAHFHASIKAAL